MRLRTCIDNKIYNKIQIMCPTLNIAQSYVPTDRTMERVHIARKGCHMNALEKYHTYHAVKNVVPQN
jgi:hypothetical protein